MSFENAINDLNTQLDEARKVAMQAMSYSSELGIVLRFLEESFVAHDPNILVNNLLGITQGFDLDCIAQYYLDRDPFVVSQSAEATPGEIEKFTKARWDTRIFSEGTITIFTFDHISLFVRDMPIDDEVRYGVLKDILATLMNGVESRLKSLLKDTHVINSQKELLILADKTIKELNSHVSSVNDKAGKAACDLIVDIKDVVLGLNILESQETDILEVISFHNSNAQDLAGNASSLENNIQNIKHSVEEIISEFEASVVSTTAPTEKEDNNSDAVELF